MQLYYAPLACSFASHLLIREAGLPVKLVPVSLTRKQLDTGADYATIAPKGQVPVLCFDDGRLLTENAAVLQALAREAAARGSAGYLPEPGTVASDEVLEWLSFIGTEIHKQCLYPVFQRDAPEPVKAWALGLLGGKLRTVARRVAEQPFLAGDRFTVADAYLAWALMLCEQSGVGFQGVEGLHAYWTQVKARPAFGECLAHEARLYRSLA
ncbi:MAG: glutathione S-transferase N-terminal domain-containing protein [Ramlibacter sp.]|nr:glutathione S-transferase N-terminal domain-containing protein [Ramlibacter sp.]